MTQSAGLDTLVARVTGQPLQMARLARVLLSKKEDAKARELCAQAIAQAPDNAEINAIAHEVFSHDVPGWHFSLRSVGNRGVQRVKPRVGLHRNAA